MTSLDLGKENSAERAYRMLRRMAMNFELRPDSKVNEAALAEQLSVSRTPLREALNRLIAEGFVVAVPNRGFTVRSLEPEGVADLYEARAEVEASIVRLACHRADSVSLAAIAAFLDQSAAERDSAEIDRLVSFDIGFHDRLAAMAGNHELRRIASNIHDRIYVIRWINMEGRRGSTQQEHRAIFDAVRKGDADTAEQLMRRHILLRQDQIIESVRKAISHVYTAHLSQA